jgi:hypothetical protein
MTSGRLLARDAMLGGESRYCTAVMLRSNLKFKDALVVRAKAEIRIDFKYPDSCFAE